MKQNQFYCVLCRKKVMVPKDQMCVKVYKNKRAGPTPALKAYCKKCDTPLTKFIKRASAQKMMDKFGRC